ncbi:MAG: purine biosynthesis protein PurH [Clostridia bacterium]|nr:purine biosynthesis protein PurH [Clostridia bacterium]
MRSLLIKDTTEEERDQIVREALGFDSGCEDAFDGYDMYLPYIMGKVELKDINASYNANYVKDMEREPRTPSCGMGIR